MLAPLNCLLHTSICIRKQTHDSRKYTCSDLNCTYRLSLNGELGRIHLLNCHVFVYFNSEYITIFDPKSISIISEFYFSYLDIKEHSDIIPKLKQYLTFV